MSFSIICSLLSWTLLLSSGCNARPSGSKVQEQSPPQTPVTSTLPSQLAESEFFGQDPGAMEAWLRFQADGRYRIARREDFQIPEAVMKEHLDDPFFTNQFAYVAGDFNRDGHLLDRAFIVIDTTTTDTARFGLVVWNATADERVLPSVHWVIKNNDLSKSVLSAATDVLSITEYGEDGAQEVCNVRWDKKRVRYSCQKGK